MPEEYVKSNVFAAKVDDLFRVKEKINMETTPFDYENFLNEVQLPTPATTTPVTTVQEAVDPFHINTVPDAADTAQIKAALSGKFSPADLFDKKTSAEQRRKTLGILSTDCIVESMTELSWQLNRQRRIVLNRLIAREELQSELDKPLPETDVFGTLLRGVLKEQAAFSTAKLKSTDIIELANVLETLQSVNISIPDINEVKSKIQSPGFLDEYTAISEGFIGRQEELHSLHKFLESGKKGKDFPVTSEGIVLTGVGGVGKSTLIAKFTSDVVAQNQATVVILDFDRPGINASDPPWLAQEISRQIGLQYPELSNEMYEVRIKARDNKKKYALGKGSFSDADLAGELAASIIYDIKDRLVETKVSKVPFLLILDTLEEVAQKDEASYLLEFLSKLASSFTGFKVKIIFSGRLYDEQLKSFTSISYIKDKPIQVNEFDHTIAKQFLLNQQLTNNMATRIVQSNLIPLRPLELKLVATLLKEGKVSFNALSKELQQLKGKRGSKNLFTGIIYRRVLMRIKDKQVRDIAYPGLILRYITPEIIINILQPALKLKKMSEQEAAILTTLQGPYLAPAGVAEINAAPHANAG
jgi:GTPase SAR1 family protein